MASKKDRVWEIINGCSLAGVVALFSFIVSVNAEIAVAKEKIKQQENLLMLIANDLKEMRKESKQDRKEILKAINRNTTQMSVIEARVINLEKREE